MSNYILEGIDFVLTQGDTGNHLSFKLIDAEGDAIDLTGASATFTMKKYQDLSGRDVAVETKVNASAATITDATGGIVSYEWSAADINETGLFAGEFKIILASSDVIHAPIPPDRYRPSAQGKYAFLIRVQPAYNI